SVPRLTKTRYRTQFFLKEIARKNWELSLPTKPNGVTVTGQAIAVIQKYFSEHPTMDSRQTVSTAGQVHPITPQPSPVESIQPSQTPQSPAQPSNLNEELTGQAETRAVARVSDENR